MNTITSTVPASKIMNLEHLAETLQTLKAHGRRVVHCHGVFDLMHVGHIRHFKQARAMGDVLVVTITPDAYVNKGPGRPAFPDDLRAEAIAALDVVDYVAVNRWPQSVETIRLLKPDVYVKGQEYRDAAADVTGGIVHEAEAVRSVGGELRFTDDIVFSSSSLLNSHLSLFPPETDQYLAAFRQRHSIDEVLTWLDRACALRPLVVGEAIIDEYLFAECIGKSTKDPILAVLFESLVTHAGGTLAIANHLAGLCREVGLVTMLGDRDRREDFVREALLPGIEPVLLTKTGSPTLHKRRVVDQYSGNKMFEIYMMNDSPTSGADLDALKASLSQCVKSADVTLVADYGHGMLPVESSELLCAQAPFLAVNSQSNAGNRGFNPVSKYRRADYVCLAKHEIHMETRRRDEGGLTDSVLQVARTVDCPKFTVTKGKDGSLHYDKEHGFFETPALATHVLDRVGAGDGLLAVTSLLVQCQAPWDIVGFVGNVAGAELVAELGNRVPLNKVKLSKHITALLK
jgi:rfaE bifunctional protein nucleotidyltransferase chain/domain